MNTEQIEVFNELKEHFWREDVLYQTIKTKERLCHSCMNVTKHQISNQLEILSNALDARISRWELAQIGCLPAHFFCARQIL